jgi:acetoin utilization deacetylase AcuC-like enzyme
MKFFHHPGFAAPIGRHMVPVAKPLLVAAAVVKVLPQIEIVEPDPVGIEDLCRVHLPKYVEAVRTGNPRSLAESQRFPCSPEFFGSVCLTNGGVLAAARQSLEDGASAALANGFHHASSDHGEGYCTFNGLVVALEALRAERKISTAAVLDLDLHYGNGTALLAATRPWLRALSIYGNDYWMNRSYMDVRARYHVDGPNHLSVPLVPTKGGDRDNMLEILEDWLPWLVAEGRPDVILYQAGVDLLREDPFSPLDLGPEDLLERDRIVFEFAKREGIPIAWTLAGGCAPDIGKVVEAHLNTAMACSGVFAK